MKTKSQERSPNLSLFFLLQLFVVFVVSRSSQAVLLPVARAEIPSTRQNLRRRDAIQPKIVGGTLAQEAYPFFIEWVGCGGSLIHDDIMLTAAHCNGGNNPFQRRVYLASQRRGTGLVRDMAKRTEHPDWDPTYARSAIEWDFLVVKLNETALVNDADFPTEVIPLNDDPNNPQGGDQVTLMGYGLTSQLEWSSEELLRDVTIDAHSDDFCQDAYMNTNMEFFSDTMLCAGEGGGKGGCQGDSGGPLIDEEGTQIGVASWREGCSTDDFPTVFARVSAAKEWIDQQICEWSCYPPTDCDRFPDIQNKCASNLPGQVNLTLTVNHDDYASETAILMEHVESATQYRFVDFKELENALNKDPLVTTVQIRNQPAGTYFFLIADSARDGICCQFSQGNITVRNDATGEILWEHNGEFTDRVEMYVNVDGDGNLLWINETLQSNGSAIMPVETGACGSSNCSNPEVDHGIWPGPYTTENTTNALMINIRYDQFPGDVNWRFQRYIADSNIEGELTEVSRTTLMNSDDWETVDNRTAPGDYSKEMLRSYRMANLAIHTYFRFVIEDKNADGLCCRNGYGWVAINNDTNVVWDVPGDAFEDNRMAQALFWVDGMGNTFLIEEGKDESSASSVPYTETETPAADKPTPSPSDQGANSAIGVPVGVAVSGGPSSDTTTTDPAPTQSPGNSGFIGIGIGSQSQGSQGSSNQPTPAPESFLPIPIADSP